MKKNLNFRNQPVATMMALVIMTCIFMYAPKGASADAQFQNFTVSIHESNSVMCTWETASQTNNASFTIEKAWSSGTKGESVTWTAVRTFPGAGNCSYTLSYAYMDNAPTFVGSNEMPDGLLLYRIRQTDVDGHSTVTAMKSVKWSNLRSWHESAGGRPMAIQSAPSALRTRNELVSAMKNITMPARPTCIAV